MTTIGYMHPPDLTLASYRYRVMIPSRELRRRGFEVKSGEGDVAVFSKHWSKSELLAAKDCKSSGIKVLYDVCDDHFSDEYESHYRSMIEVADAVTCPTDAMAARILEETGVAATVISDPYEYPCLEPRINTHIRRVLWFGNADFTGLSVLGDIGDRILMVVSGKEPPFKAHFMPWSRERMLMAFQWADVVVIPMRDTPKNRCKSPNRLVEAVRQGKYVLASPVAEYGRYGLYTGDIPAGLKYLEENRDLCILALQDAQSKVELLHSPQTIGAQWATVFEGLMDGSYNLRRTQDRHQQLAQA